MTDETRQSFSKDKIGIPKIYEWDWRPGYEIRVSKGEQLFPRIEMKKEKKKEQSRKEKVEAANLISINEFYKIEMKVGKVLQAERIKGSSKLIKLQIDTGEQRQIVAGIGNVYNPEELIGRKIVVVENLKPAKLAGIESKGMLLAATDSDGRPVILIPEKDVKEGSRIK